MVIKIDRPITPATAIYVEHALIEAKENNDAAVIITMDTPGGLMESTRNIVQNIFASPVPVIAYVSPSGARAASAGAIITLASGIAAMAPGTNMGAAHPVDMQGKTDSTVMGQKIENDAAAWIRSIAAKRNRNVNFAESLVRHSYSFTAREALDSGAIDMIAENLNDLIAKCDGKIVSAGGKTFSLKLENYKIIDRDMDFREEVLSVLSNPNFAYIFILIGIYGLLFELKSPGSVFPGVVGGISLILAAFSMQMLPINTTGLLFIIFAFGLFITELFVASYGILSIGGLISFVIGSLMLIDSTQTFMRISLKLIVIAAILMAAFLGLVVWLGAKAQMKKKTSGSQNLVGMKGIAKTPISPDHNGTVLVNGELWKARSKDEIHAGEAVLIQAIEDFTVIVNKNS